MSVLWYRQVGIPAFPLVREVYGCPGRTISLTACVAKCATSSDGKGGYPEAPFSLISTHGMEGNLARGGWLTRFLSWTAATALCLALAQSGAQAKVTKYSDNTFANGNWTAAFEAANTTSGTSLAQQATGGVGNSAYLQILNTSDKADIWAYAFMNAATYTPSAQGALLSLAGSFDCRMFQYGQGVGLALQQNGKYYYAPYNLTYPSSWTNIPSGNYLTKGTTKVTSWSGLTSSDFRTFADRNGNGSNTSHPDFSANGGKITFGIVNLNYNINTTRNTITGFDDFNLALTSIPEPAFYQLGAMLGLGALAYLRRRRS